MKLEIKKFSIGHILNWLFFRRTHEIYKNLLVLHFYNEIWKTPFHVLLFMNHIMFLMFISVCLNSMSEILILKYDASTLYDLPHLKFQRIRHKAMLFVQSLI